MSAVEISQEERDLWRFEASDECGTPSEEDERILRLLKTLEASEADLERSCEETRANFSELYRMANEVVPELKRRAEKAEAERKKDLAHCKYEFERAENAEAQVARLREKLKSALDKIENIQDSDSYGVWEGVCHACGICAGCHEGWEPTDDHNCRVMLELWSNGEPLPWEAAREAVEGKG